MTKVIDIQSWQSARMERAVTRLISALVETPDEQLTKRGRRLKREIEDK